MQNESANYSYSQGFGGKIISMLGDRYAKLSYQKPLWLIEETPMGIIPLKSNTNKNFCNLHGF